MIGGFPGCANDLNIHNPRYRHLQDGDASVGGQVWRICLLSIGGFACADGYGGTWAMSATRCSQRAVPA